MNVDHIIPKSKGGSNEIVNLQPMCAYHNHKKGNIISDPEITEIIKKNPESVIKK
jgi:5-methylcytosine-specific restriction endonuclease McrA